VLLADVFPTGYHGCELAELAPGETVAIYGAGPVGLMAALSASLRGASKIFVVDRVTERLDKAESIGAILINFEEADPVDQILEQTDGDGTDKGIDAVGYQAQESGGDTESPAQVLNQLVHTVRATGKLGSRGYTCRLTLAPRTRRHARASSSSRWGSSSRRVRAWEQASATSSATSASFAT
jgi:glutathione-independent formaldehyde dehydrogenase